MFEAGTRLGPYEIVAHVGAGGMGEVYRALDTRLRRDVALKILTPRVSADDAGRKRFLREARAISALSHPNICSLYDIGSQDGQEFLVMEYLEGETLAQRLSNSGALEVDEAVRYAIDIASALEQAHRKGVVHRDLKPGNVMITTTGAKLLDFGLARLATTGEESASAPLTTEGLMIGTIEYMAPEQLNGETVDARSDIFAFGVLLYEMLTGARPFIGQNRASVIGAILFGQPEPLPRQNAELPPTLERLIAACLEKDPDNRIQTAHDLRLQLQWMAEGERADAVPKRRRIRVARPMMVGMTALAFLAGSLAAIGIAAWRTPEKQSPQMRFSLTAPAGQHVDWPVIAPDGSRIAFVVETEDGQRSLWVRDTGSTTARLLPGTEGATQPFWSPDSTAVAFFSTDKLQVVRLTSRRSEPLANAMSPRGGTWNADGTLLFTPHVSSAIWRTSTAGTQPRELTRLEPASRDVTHRWPEFLPDGEHYLFVILSRNLQRSGLYVGSLRDAAVKKISTLQSRAVVSADGWMFFVRDRTLYRQRFDLKRHSLAGQPVAVGAGVLPDLKVTGAVRVSVSHTGMLAFASPPDTRTTIVRTDRSGRVLQTLAPPGYYVNPSLSPDEKTLALSRIDEQTGRNSIWLLDTATGAMSPFVADDANADAPFWKADGTRILYSSDRRGAYEVFERAVGSVAADRLVLPSRAYAQVAGVARTGTLFHLADPEAWGAFWFWPKGAAQPHHLATGSEGSSPGAADLSPDGRWIARLYVAGDNARYGVEISMLEDPERRVEIGGEGGSNPAWRPDGREIYYLSSDGYIKAVAFDDGRIGLTTPLFRQTMKSAFYGNADFVPSRDGTTFVILQPVASEQTTSATVVVNWHAEPGR